VYDDGDAYNASVLDISDDDVAHAFFDGVRQVAALSLALQHPTIVSVPHSLLNAYKQVLSLGLSCNKYSFEKLDKVTFSFIHSFVAFNCDLFLRLSLNLMPPLQKYFVSLFFLFVCFAEKLKN